MDKDSKNGSNSSRTVSVCNNKQIVIYEYLNKAQNLMVNNNETLLSSNPISLLFHKSTLSHNLFTHLRVYLLCQEHGRNAKEVV